MQYLAAKAELTRLQGEVNEVIRSHIIHCPCGCKVQQKLRELNYLDNQGNKFLVKDCSESTLDRGTPLAGDSLASIERVLQYSSVQTKDLFDK
jgi:hypothetical protein